MTPFIIPIDNQLSYRSIRRNGELKLDIKNHCDFPSRSLVVDWRGNCFVCACEAWLPITVGNILDFTRLSDIWATPTALALQQDIDSKKFTHCAVDRCGILHHDQRSRDYSGSPGLDSYYISINIDESCNLRCPSCRRGNIMHTAGADYEAKLQQVRHLVTLLEGFDRPCHIIMSGNGDPLASTIMRPLLHNFKPGAEQTIRLFTNGLLLEKQLTDNSIVNNITQYFISIDAGTAEVYERVRLGGRWATLLKNFDFLRTVVARTGAEVLLKFVLQQDNYQDMQNFINIGREYGFRTVINRLEDWGTWPDFALHDVIGNTSHPAHLAAIAHLREVYQLNHTQVEFNSSLKDLCQ